MTGRDAANVVAKPQPSVVILAGPNGAGKSTVAPALLQGALGVTEFVNADDIARGLSAFDAEGTAMTAGRVMLARLRELAQQHVSFAFETTLASRSFAPWLKQLTSSGYSAHLVFLWLPSAEFAVERVAERVRAGGHDVPAETIRRRYRRGLRNLLGLYQELASTWRLYDASGAEPHLVAARLDIQGVKVYDENVWALVKRYGTADER